MYKVILYNSSHDLEVGINEMLTRGYMLFNIVPGNQRGYIAIYVEIQEPTLPTNEEQGVDEKTLEKNTNLLEDGDQTNS